MTIEEQTKLNKNFISACVLDNIETTKILIEAGANIHTTDSFGRTPFMISCFNHSYGVANLLYKYGADINAKNYNGQTALIYACIQNCYKTIQFLVQIGANTNIQDKYGKTALMWICQKDSNSTSQLLSNIKTAFNNLWVPRGLQYYDNIYKTAKLLIEHGANINISDNNGKTAFDYCETQEMKDLTQSTMNKKKRDGHLLC